MRALAKLTEVVDGQPRIISDPPLIVPIEEVASGLDAAEIEEFVRGAIRSYRRTLTADRRRLLENFRYAHAARKVVGVGSVGTRAWIMLMLGRDESDPLFLQLKEAQASVLEPFLGKTAFNSHGQRVVEGQRLTQAASDIMLGWIRLEDPRDGASRDFYMRQLWDGKGSALVDAMDPQAMTLYAQLCGWSLAKAHARSATRSRSPAISATATASTARWRCSRKPTPTRTSATIAPSTRPSPPGRLVAETGL